MKTFLLIFFLLMSAFAISHDGHHEKKIPDSENVHEQTNAPMEGRPRSWTQWIGGFHLIFLHFPIALINMLVISEILFMRTKKGVYDASSHFLVISAAIFTPLTALLGLIYSYSSSYHGEMEFFLNWHMWLGIATSIIVVLMAFIRKNVGLCKVYYWSLIVLALLINLTSYFGGAMTFGPYQLLFPAKDF